MNLLLARQYVNILNSRQMGKSSLMVRAAYALNDQGARTSIVDLAAELGSPPDASTYFQGIVKKISRDLSIDLDIATWWSSHSEETINQRFISFFRDVVLVQIDQPVVVFLDEIDSTLKLGYTDDLFTALRGLYNLRAELPTFERLTFCLLGVASPNELIKDRRTTPYNVGQTVELTDFCDRDDLTALCRALGVDWETGRRLVDRVLYWTDGHPYLTLSLCYRLRQMKAETNAEVDRLVGESFQCMDRVANDVHFQAIIRFLETRLTDGHDSFRLYRSVLNGKRERDRTRSAHVELKLSGLVKRDAEGYLIVRNRIYRRLFDRQWVERSAPTNALRSYRRLAIAASLSFLFTLFAGGFYYVNTLLPEQQKLAALEELSNLKVNFTVGANGGLRVAFPERASEETFTLSMHRLKAMPNVTELDLGGEFDSGCLRDGVQISDLSDLALMKNIRSINLSCVPISDISPLENLANLEVLNIAGTEVKDLQPLQGLIKLRQLDLWGTEVSEIGAIAKMTALQWLDLEGTEVSDLAPLKHLTKLRELILTNTKVSDIEPLRNLGELRSLNLWNLEISDISPLEDLSKLEKLDLEGTDVADLRPLEDLTELMELTLADTKVTDLTQLKHLTGLQILNIEDTQISDISVLESLKALQDLDLEDTSVSDLRPLADLAQLEVLDLEDTSVRDLDPLGKLDKLQELALTGTLISDVDALKTLPNLQRLYIYGAKVSQPSITRLQEKLTDLRIRH